MKQAILITAYKHFGQLYSLIKFFDNDFSIYIHIDKKSNINDAELKKIKKLSNVKICLQEYRIFWGGTNHLKAYLALAREAFKDETISYFHLITGQDYPVKSLEEFKSYFHHDKNENYLEYFSLPAIAWKNENGGLDRIEYYNFYDIINPWKHKKWLNRILNFQKRIGFKRKITNMPALYGGSTYWSLTREAIHYVLNYSTNNPNFLRRFHHTFCAEEFYFQTILLNSNLKHTIINNNLRYIDWSTPHRGLPAVLDESDFPKIKNSSYFFARKIDPHRSRLLLELIKDSN